LDIIVVASGCTDDTAEVAGAFGHPVRVLNRPAASKPAALKAGDEAPKAFPRVYLDADVEIGAVGYTSIRDLFAIIARNPLLTTRRVVFLSVTVLARRQGNRAVQRSDYRIWLRDESSRD
jgi:hypothetical protein